MSMIIVDMLLVRPVLLFGNIGVPELIFLVILVLLLFGAKRIPDLMKSMGKGVRSFKEGINDIEKDINSDKKKEDSTKE